MKAPYSINIIPRVRFILESLLTSAPNMVEFVRTGLYYRSEYPDTAKLDP